MHRRSSVEEDSVGSSTVCPIIPQEPRQRVASDLCRLTRFGANITDAHSCFIFLPAQILQAFGPSGAGNSELDRALLLVGFHSLSSDVIRNCRLPRGSGLIGWVATHNRSIHVSPFELDSRTLGIYSNDQQLKSFIGIPIPLDKLMARFGLVQTSGDQRSTVSGVLACDSKKSFAFSKLQGKLLEDLAREVSNSLELHAQVGVQSEHGLAWQTFLKQSEEVLTALGTQSVELLRLKLKNFDRLEAALGTSACLALCEQTLRLLQQALPPHFPVVRIINGDILLFVDSMMSSFYENKIRALCEHIAGPGRRPEFECVRASFRDKKRRVATIEGLVALTGDLTADTNQHSANPQQLVTLDKELSYGNRRS